MTWLLLWLIEAILSHTTPKPDSTHLLIHVLYSWILTQLASEITEIQDLPRELMVFSPNLPPEILGISNPKPTALFTAPPGP